MANQDVVNYLKEGKKRGFGLDILKQKLIEGGFSEKDVDEAVNELEKKELPNLPISSQSGTGQVGQEIPKKKSGFWKWFIIIFLILIVVGLGFYVYTLF